MTDQDSDLATGIERNGPPASTPGIEPATSAAERSTAAGLEPAAAPADLTDDAPEAAGGHGGAGPGRDDGPGPADDDERLARKTDKARKADKASGTHKPNKSDKATKPGKGSKGAKKNKDRDRSASGPRDGDRGGVDAPAGHQASGDWPAPRPSARLGSGEVPPEAQERAPAARLPRWVVPALAVLAVVALASSLFALGQRNDANSVRAEGRKGQAAALAAGRFAQMLFTYDEKDPGAHRQTLVDHATEEYRQRWDGGESVLPQQGSGSVVGETLSAKPTEVDGDRVEVLVETRFELRSAGQVIPARSHLLVEMRRVDGEWRANAIDGISLRPEGTGILGEGGTPAPAPGTPNPSPDPSPSLP